MGKERDGNVASLRARAPEVSASGFRDFLKWTHVAASCWEPDPPFELGGSIQSFFEQVYNPRTKVVEANAAAAALYAFDSVEELLGRDVVELVPNCVENVTAFTEWVRSGFAPWAGLFRKTRTDGSEVLAHTSLLPVIEGGHLVRCWALSTIDSERLEAALAGDTLANIVRTMAEGAATATMDGKLLWTNATFERMYGYESGALAGQHESCLLPEDGADPEHTPEAIWARVRERGSWDGVVRRQRADGTPLWVRVRARRMPHTVRGEIGVLIHEDRTPSREAEQTRRELEAQLRHAQMMETLGTLAGGIAHDFNNQLTVVLGNLDLAAERSAADDPKLPELQDALTAARRCSEITRTLLALGRQADAQMRAVDLNEIVEEAARLLRRVVPSSIRLETQVPDLPTWVLADSTQIQQVVLNLAVNARDAMPDGGTMTISTGVCDLDAADCEGRDEARPGRYSCLKVADTGTGMQPDVAEHAFRAFFTTKPDGQGTGLGLPMVAGIVQAHDGWIDLRTAPDQGATFTLYFPSRSGRPEDETEQALLRARDGETILVIDEEAMIRDYVRRLLREHGYQVVAASKPSVGLDILEERENEIDLAMIDVNAPGFDARLVREVLDGCAQPVPVVLSSGLATGASPELAEALPDVPFLHKPFHGVSLLRAIRDSLDRARRGELD